MKEQHSIDVKKYSEWNLLLKQDFRGIFRSLVEASGDFLTGNIPKGGLEVLDVLQGIVSDKNDPVEHRAYLLIYNSLRRAMLHLVWDSKDILQEVYRDEIHGGQNYDAAKFQKLVDRLSFKFEKEEFAINRDFLSRPEQLPLVEQMRAVLETWYVKCKVPKAKAQHIGRRLKYYFVRMLDEVMREKPTYFGQIGAELKAYFPSDLVWGRMQYNNSLIEEMDQPIFGESFGLAQVFIPLRGFHRVKEEGKRGKEKGERKKKVVDALSHIWDWLTKDQWDFEIMVIRGGPGSGKSSIMKETAKQLAIQKDNPVYFIPLHHFEYGTGIMDGIERFIRMDEFLKEDPFDAKLHGSSRRPIFIFDGLDELSRSSGSGKAIAADFVVRLKSMLSEINQRKGWQAKAIVTGRDFIVQQTTEIPDDVAEQVLELLPYRVDSESMEWVGHSLEDQEKILEEDQRKFWWKNYWKSIGKNRKKIPEAIFNNKELEPLSIQPLLSYLLALAYNQGVIKDGEQQNINSIYQGLISNIRERRWGDHQHVCIGEESYLRVYQEVAVTAWHSGDVRTTTLAAIKERCKKEGIEDLVDEFKQEDGDAYNRLVIAFFLKGKGIAGSGEKLVEFTHKSFGEYLVARKITTELIALLDEWENKKSKTKIKTVADAWMELCGPECLTTYIWEFIQREVAIQVPEKEIAARYQKQLCKLFDHFIGEGIEIPSLARTNREVVKMTRNAEEALLLLLAAFAKVSQKSSIPEWPTPPANVIQFISSANFNLSIECFYRMNFPEKSTIGVMGLSFFQLNMTSFHNCSLEFCSLFHTNLKEADLSMANLWSSNLQRTILEGANLSDANLDGANLERVILKRAILKGVYLTQYTSFKNTDCSVLAPLSHLFYEGNKIEGDEIKEILKSLGGLFPEKDEI